MTDPKPRSGSICTVDEMKDAIEEASHEEHLADGSKVNKKLMRVRSVSIDNTIEEKMVEVIENLKAPKEHVTVEENEETLPDGTIHITRKVTKHSFTHIERQHKQEGFVEKVFEGDVKIPGTESREILESFEKPPFPETVVEHVDEVQADGEVKQRKVIKNRMVHQVRTRHQSFDNEKGQLIEEAEIDEVIPGTESTWYADAGTDSESESETEEQQEKVDLGRVEEFADDGTVVTKEIVETRTTTTRTIHSRTGSINQETTESVLTEEFITPSPSPRSVSPADPKMGIPVEDLSKMREEFLADSKHKLAQDMCHYHSIRDMTLSPRDLLSINHVFNTKVEEGKPMCNQKSSGRCWIFACMNQLRIPFMEKYELSEFEFSQAYLFFWDKLERSNYLLDAFVDCARKGHVAGSRVVDYLLMQAIDDGGQWDMLVNLIVKYGVVPKSIYPDTISCEMSKHLGAVINSKMREYCKTLQDAVVKGVTDLDLKVLKKDMLKELYTVLSITLGTPPATITWEYYNKNKVYQKVDNLTPLEFYKQYVQPCWDVTEMVCLVNDPRVDNPFNKLYTVEYLGNVTDGSQVLYINQPVEQLKKFALAQLKDKKSVWFGCDVGKQFQGKQHGVLDLRAHDYMKVFGFEIQTLTKADRLIYRESLMTHAMLFTGVNVSAEGDKADKWRVENSWGDEDGDKGYLVMSDDWFSEFVYEVVVHKKYLPAEILAILDQKPTMLPAWDPMGSLA